jgi:hypothetical protein
MAKLNLNFHQQTGRRKPTENEIAQIGALAYSVEAIIKTLSVYTNENNNQNVDGNVCMSVCDALELLIEPIVDYMCNYAGDVPAPENLHDLFREFDEAMAETEQPEEGARLHLVRTGGLA